MIAVDGMPGWQITLIAVSAALVAGTAAVFLDRARVRPQPTRLRDQVTPGPARVGQQPRAGPRPGSKRGPTR